MNLVTVQCMGAFREIGESFTVSVEEMVVISVRAAVEDHLTTLSQTTSNPNLAKVYFDLVSVLARSAFASGDDLLRDNDSLRSNEVVLLPPVAGG